MRGLVASVFLAAAVLPALADDSSNTRQVPIALFFKGPSSYPPDAAAKGEEGFVVIAIVPTPDNRLPRAKLVESSGYSDLDAASLELALPYYRSGQMKNANFLAIKWSLKENDQVDPAPPVPK